MIYVKQCVCGSTDFETEPDDNVLRCEKCCRLARFARVEIKEENDND